MASEDQNVAVTTCLGCLEDQPNQLAHMDPGGCLYDGYLDDLDNDSGDVGIRETVAPPLASLNTVKNGRVRREPVRFGK